MSSRQSFSDASEKALSAQINKELTASYAYRVMASHFGKDHVSLPGFKKFFLDSAEEENQHAQKLIDYTSKRGGSVTYKPIAPCEKTEWTALESMEFALALEKEVNQCLLDLHKVADDSNDPQMTDFIEGEFLEEQVDSIKEIADHITQLKRAGEGLGVFLFDKDLQ